MTSSPPPDTATLARAKDIAERAANGMTFYEGWEPSTTRGAAIALAAALRSAEARVKEMEGLTEWAVDRLHEINLSNYSHEDVGELNNRSVEVALALSATLKNGTNEPLPTPEPTDA